MMAKFQVLLQNSKIRQTGILTFANVISLGLGFLLTVYLPKALGAHEYGVFSLVCAVLNFVAVFFEFGFFVSIAKILIETRDQDKIRSIVKLALIILFYIAISFAICIYGLSFFIDDLLHNKIGAYLMAVSSLSISCVLPFVAGELLKATGEIYHLAAYKFFCKLLYFCGIVIGVYYDLLTVQFCLWAFLLTPVIAFIATFSKYLFVKVEHKKLYWREIWIVNEEFGIKNYISRIISTPSGQINKLIIGYFCGATDVGLFSLCCAFSLPIMLISESISSVQFKSCEKRRSYSLRYVQLNILINVILSVGCFICVYALFAFYYNRIYPNWGVWLSLIVICAGGLQGIYTPYNEWLAANGLGNEMLSIAKVYAILSLLFNCVFIVFLGIWGAAITLLLINFYALMATLYYYNKERRLV